MKTFKEFLNETIDIKENLNEMATVYRDKDKKQLCQVNPDKGRQCLEYFKLYDSDSFDKVTKIARISFREPKYVIHKNDRGFDDWKLNVTDKQNLKTLLEQQSDKYEGYTNFQAAIIDFNMEKGLNVSQTKENFVENPKYPKYLPIDLPMPNYDLLPR